MTHQCRVYLFIYLLYFIRILYISESQCYNIKKQYKCEKDNPRHKKETALIGFLSLHKSTKIKNKEAYYNINNETQDTKY